MNSTELFNGLLKGLTDKEKELGKKEEVLRGIMFLSEMVKVTLGSKGRNFMYRDKLTQKPKITKDGVTVTRNVFSKDPFEQMGIDVVKEAAEKTVKSSGDGTTTTIIMAEQFILRGMKMLQEGKMSYYQLAKELDAMEELIVNEIKKASIDVKNEAERGKLLNVATVSANSPEIGQLIYDTVNKIGLHGSIEVKKSRSEKTKVDAVKGIKVHRGFMAPQLVNDQTNMVWHVEGGAFVVVLDQVLRSIQDIIPYVEAVNGKRDAHGEFVTNEQGQVILVGNSPILFMINDIDNTLMDTMIQNKLKNQDFNVMFVQHDGFGERSHEIMNDICALTGATVGNKDGLGDIGYCEEVIVDEDTTSILGGYSNEELVKTLVKETKTRLQKEDVDDNELAYLNRRLSTLLGGVAVIYVGGKTNVEMLETKDRIDDAVEAVKAAIREGVCIGGGHTVLNITKTVRSSVQNNRAVSDMFCSVLEAPFYQLCLNSDIDGESMRKNIQGGGVGLDVTVNRLIPLSTYKIYDPASVLIDSLRNSLAVAKSILSIERTFYLA